MPSPSHHGSGRQLTLKFMLMAAFTAMFLATVATGIVAASFQFRIGTLFAQVQQRDFPLATGALKLADQSSTLVEAARTLAAADSQESRQSAAAIFTQRAQKVAERFEALRQAGGDSQTLDPMASLLSKTRDAAIRLDALVDERLKSAETRRESMVKLHTSHTAFLSVFQPLITERTLAIQQVTMDQPADMDGLSLLVTKLVSKDMPIRQALSDAIGDVNLLLTQFGKIETADAKQLAALTKEAEATYKRIEFTADFLAGILRKEEPRKATMAVAAFALGKESLFALRQAELASRAAASKAVTELFQAVDTLGQEASALAAAMEANAALADKQVDASISEAMFGVGGIVAIALVFGALSGIFLVNRNIRRITVLSQTMGLLAEGNLDTDIPDAASRDEIGSMARALEVFKRNGLEVLRLQFEQEQQREAAETARRQAMLDIADRFEANVSSIVEAVYGAAEHMQKDASHLSSNAVETTRQAVDVAGSAEQVSGSVGDVATAAEQMTGAIEEISRQISESSQIASVAVQEANRTNNTVAGLSEAAQRIGEVVNLINNIASQTNLLALNATIEAARAGEAGKGFAVVAGEVKNLANQTAKATEDIQTQVAQVQAVTQAAVQAIQSIGTTISHMREITVTISSAVEEQHTVTRQIAHNVQEAAIGTQGVSENIAFVSRAAEETGSIANTALNTATHLRDHAVNLRGEVERFIQAIRAG